MKYELIKTNNAPGLTAVETVFAHRGMDITDIIHYLNTNIDDLVHPMEFDNIGEAARMLITHINNQDKTLIIVDSDVDGFTSAAALINYLNHLFPSFVQNNITYWLHNGKQHGIEENFVPRILAEDFKFVICPDSSSNDYEQHTILKQHGIDVLVLDHHEAEKVSENACVVNNQLCNYPTKSLSGAGVVYKFCAFIDQVMEINYANEIMDLAALGLIGDMMDIKDMETKYIIDTGLNHVINPLFSEMIKTQNYSISKGGGLNPFTVAWYIVPQINAVNRAGTMKEKMLLFESMLNFLGYKQIPSTKRGCSGQMETMVEQACRLCANVRNRQNRGRDDGMAVIEYIIESNSLLDNKIIVVQLKDTQNIDRNLSGLMANQLAAKYQHPILILSKVVHENGEIGWEGSGRGIGLEDFKGFLKSTGLVYLAEGHANAFGAGILDENIKQLIQYSNEELKDYDFSEKYKVDFIWQSTNVIGQDIVDLASLNTIWGQGLEKPNIAVENIMIRDSNIQLLSREKSPTLKITLPDGTEMIKFGSSLEEFQNLGGESEGYSVINIVGTCDINEWRGRITPQIKITDYEVIRKGSYCF